MELCCGKSPLNSKFKCLIQTESCLCLYVDYLIRNLTCTVIIFGTMNQNLHSTTLEQLLERKMKLALEMGLLKCQPLMQCSADDCPDVVGSVFSLRIKMEDTSEQCIDHTLKPSMSYFLNDYCIKLKLLYIHGYVFEKGECLVYIYFIRYQF